jgi:hypothetical protein
MGNQVHQAISSPGSSASRCEIISWVSRECLQRRLTLLCPRIGLCNNSRLGSGALIEIENPIGVLDQLFEIWIGAE